MNFLSLFLFKQKIDLEILQKDFLNWGRKCADHLKAPFQTFTMINPMRKTKKLGDSFGVKFHESKNEQCNFK